MIFGDLNAHLGTAQPLVIVLGSVIVFALGLGIVAVLSTRFLGLARYGVTVFIGLAIVGLVTTVLFGPFFLATDGPEYDRQAVGVAARLHGESAGSGLTGGKEGWPLLLGAVYAILGRVTFVGILLSCIAVAVSAIFVAGTATLLWGRFSPLALYGWYFCTPLLVFLGPSLMREALCWMAIALLAFGTVALSRHRAHAFWALLVGAGVLLAVRTSLALLVLAALAVSWAVCTLLARKLYFLVAVVAIATVAAASASVGVILGELGWSEQMLEANRVYISADATTGFATNALQPGPLGYLSTAAQVAPRVVLGPFPWEMQLAPAWIWVGANSLAWLLLLVLAARSLAVRGQRRWRCILLVAGGLLLFGISVTLTNYGIIVRMRGACMMLWLPLVLGGLQRGRRVIRSQFAATNTEASANPQMAPVSAPSASPASGPAIMTTVSK